MAKHAIGPMILTAAILAVPALAATTTTDSTATTSPPVSSPASPRADTGMPATRSTTTTTTTRATTATPGAHAAAQSTPKYTTADGQIRVGKVVGTSVYNDQDQSVGSIDDVLMSHDNKATTAVISVGGFLGMGSKLVSVPFDQLKIQGDRVMMPGATKESLKGMPEYKYSA